MSLLTLFIDANAIIYFACKGSLVGKLETRILALLKCGNVMAFKWFYIGGFGGGVMAQR